MVKLNILHSAIFLLVFFSRHLSPEFFWLAGFASYAAPLVVLSNFGLLVLNLALKKKFAIANAVLLILSYPVISATFAFPALGFSSSKGESFSVMSYNVKVFNVYEPENKLNQYAKSKVMTDWIDNHQSDILCLQEFFHRSDDSIFNTVEKFGKKRHVYFHNLKTDISRSTFGLAIISKFPIIRKGEVEINTFSLNACIFADLLIGKDTVRIYNLHLQSMNIDEKQIVNYDRLKNKYWGLFLKLKNGFIRRARQIEIIIAHAANSPVKNIVLCGDFNELPYGYVYLRANENFGNAFEKKGRGFGFSYNGRLKFLRIDHIFFGGNLNPQKFETLHSVEYSDHFPLRAEFSFDN
jgi:endonuclease/exonuclease/phosphatase family metal-dependent hydrolase